MRQVVDRDGEGAAGAVTPDDPRSDDRTRWLLLALIAVLVLPLAVAAVALRTPRWHPVLDLAMTELRLRDVFTSHTPLIGLPGRIGRFPEQGSHPGPMSFYALWPTWKVLGASAWGMQVGALVLNALCVGATVLIANRRGGLRLAITLSALLVLLLNGYGIATLAEPWNPYMPLLWWVVTLLAVWSVVCGDVVLLPVAVVSASMAAQTHVPYLGLCLGVGAVAVGALVVQWRRGEHRREIRRWGAIAVALVALLWSPLLVDQATKEPGNLSMLWEHFTSPPTEEGPPVGVGEGVELALRHLDLTALFTGEGDSLGSLARASGDAGGSVLPGVAVLAVWLAAALVAWRRRYDVLNRLNVVVGTALLLGVYSMSRIFGKVWYYLMLWSWGTAMLLVLSVGWTIARLLPSDAFRRGATAALAGVALVGSALLSVEAARAEPPAPQLSEVLGVVLPDVTAALDRDLRYLVTWDDSFYIGSQGYGLVSELDRRGFDVGVLDPWRVPVTHHRVFTHDEVDMEVHLAVGGFVERWRAVDGARELAWHDPRSPAERAEYDRLHDLAAEELRATGHEDVVPLLDDNLFGASLVAGLPDAARAHIEAMLELGSPGAVFLIEPGTTLG